MSSSRTDHPILRPMTQIGACRNRWRPRACQATAGEQTAKPRGITRQWGGDEFADTSGCGGSTSAWFVCIEGRFVCPSSHRIVSWEMKNVSCLETDRVMPGLPPGAFFA